MQQHNRLSLDVVGELRNDNPEQQHGTVALDDYSRFKYGDGGVAEQYGERLADTFADAHTEMSEGRILVTSSAYKVAPPASESLVLPFTDRLEERFPNANIEHFKIDRTVLTQGDYASMPIEQREEVMSRNGLKLPRGLDTNADAIVALDDILVTGSHEMSIQKLFDRSGVESEAYYAYILQVGEGVSDPRIEAAINHCAIKSLADVARLANASRKFVPNARICKMVASSSNEDIVGFSETVEDTTILRTIHEYISGDELEAMPAYEAGARTFARYVLARV